MGVEHSQMERLWTYAVADKPRVERRLPRPPAGQPQPKDLKDSPNQRALRRAIWCLEAALAGDEKAWDDAVERALAHFDEMREWGHMSDGPDGRTEVFTASHRQLWYAAMAAHPWAGSLAAEKGWGRADDLLRDTIAFWRLETAVALLCHFTDESRAQGKRRPRTLFTVLVPGARMGDEGKPFCTNEQMDEVIEWLLGERGVPRTPDQGNYAAVIPLLKKAAEAGVILASLVGNATNVARIPARLGWNLKHLADGGYYAWFTDLGFVYDGLHAAGRVNGATVLKWTRDEAVEFGESLEP